MTHHHMHGMQACFDSSDRYADTKRAIADLVERLHRGRIAPPALDELTEAETHALLVVESLSAEGSVRPGQVACASRTTPSALSQTLKTLESKGLVKRTRSDQDCRAVVIELTEEGTRAVCDTRSLRNEYWSRLLDYLGEEDVRTLIRIMGRLAEYRER